MYYLSQLFKTRKMSTWYPGLKAIMCQSDHKTLKQDLHSKSHIFMPLPFKSFNSHILFMKNEVTYKEIPGFF